MSVLAHVGPGLEITNGCIVGAGCKLLRTEVLPENTVVYGSDCARRIAMDKPPVCYFLLYSEFTVNFRHYPYQF